MKDIILASSYTSVLSLILTIPWLFFRKQINISRIIAFAAAYILAGAILSAGAYWQSFLFKSLQYNWLGKLLSIGAGLALIPLLIKSPYPFRSSGVVLYINPERLLPCVAAGMGLVLLKTGMALLDQGIGNITVERFIYEAALPGIEEEMWYRGILLWLLQSALSQENETDIRKAAPEMLLLAVLYGLGNGLQVSGDFKVTCNIPLTILMAGIGYAYTWIRIRSGSLLLPVIFHNFVNMTVVLTQWMK